MGRVKLTERKKRRARAATDAELERFYEREFKRTIPISTRRQRTKAMMKVAGRLAAVEDER